MDPKDIEKAVSDSRRYFDHDAAKQIIKEKYEAKMLFTAYDGMWKAGPELLSLTFGLQNKETFVILDEYGNPCKVEPEKLRAQAWEIWQEQMNGWYAEYEDIQKER